MDYSSTKKGFKSMLRIEKMEGKKIASKRKKVMHKEVREPVILGIGR